MHAVLFVPQRWQRAQLGLPQDLVEELRSEALRIASVVPRRPAAAYLAAAKQQLAGFRELLRTARALSENPGLLPEPDQPDAELALWVLGLARELSR